MAGGRNVLSTFPFRASALSPTLVSHDHSCFPRHFSILPHFFSNPHAVYMFSCHHPTPHLHFHNFILIFPYFILSKQYLIFNSILYHYFIHILLLSNFYYSHKFYYYHYYYLLMGVIKLLSSKAPPLVSFLMLVIHSHLRS